MSDIAWLPELIFLEDSGGDWDSYLSALYDYFQQDFIRNKPVFNGTKLGLKKHPVIDEKEATFWHFISEGDVEEDRLPNLRRCERIRWPKPLIDRAPAYGESDKLKVWKNKRKNETRINIWLEEENYLVVLAERKGYLLPWTAFCIEREHQKRKKQRDYEQYMRNPW